MTSKDVFMKYPKQDEAEKKDAPGGSGEAKPVAGADAPDKSQKPDAPDASAAGEGEPSGDDQAPAGEGEKKPSAPAAGADVNKRFSELTDARKRAEKERDDANKRLSQALEAVERLTGKPAVDVTKKADQEDPEPAAPAFEDPGQYQTAMAKYAKDLSGWASRREVKAALAEDQRKRVEDSHAQATTRVQSQFRKRR